MLHSENRRLKAENNRLKEMLHTGTHRRLVKPFQIITGETGHKLPEMYGKVKEKTMWSYWHDAKNCPSSKQCVLPPQVQLCVETFEKNKGSFDFKLVHADEITKYVSLLELPLQFKRLRAPHQKDALMNALLARYGGVALDISTILLRPLDDHWDEMVAKGATFRGYLYRINGQPWRHAEVSVVWFLMARREGIFSIAVRNQVIGLGDQTNTRIYHHWYLALGDQTLLPILSMFNYSLPKCYEDPAIKNYHKFPDQDPNWCPENEQPPWYLGITGPPRTDTRIMLRDPRDGPQLPFAFAGMISWHISDTKHRWDPKAFRPGSPMYNVNCTSSKTCWENVFLPRYHAVPKPGEAPLLSFIKLFHHGAEFDGKSRSDILADHNTYFYTWLKMAGLPDFV